MGARDKKAGATGSWQKVKVDRQIVAIAKVHAVDELYTEDEDVRQLANSMGFPSRACRTYHSRRQISKTSSPPKNRRP